MVYKCCVPNCKGNYDSGPKKRCFKFPDNEELRKKWIHSIPRKHFIPTKNSRVCEDHFEKNQIILEISHFDEKTGKLITAPIQKPRLKDGAIPQIFPQCPSYLSSATSSRESPLKKKRRREAEATEKAIADSIQSHVEYESKFKFTCFQRFVEIAMEYKVSEFWSVIRKPEFILYTHMEMKEYSIQFMHSVVIDDSLDLKVYMNSTMIPSLRSNYKFPMNVESFHEVMNILDLIEKQSTVPSMPEEKYSLPQKLLQDLVEESEEEKKSVLSFLSSQLELLQQKKNAHKFSADFFVFSSLLYLLSPCAYKFLRKSGNIILPHPNTIRRVCSSLKVGPESEDLSDNFLFCIKQRVIQLDAKERCVILMLDEIHLKQYLDYKGGSVVGTAFDSQELASSAQVFMIQSLFSQFKEVVHILPVNKIKAEKLHDMIRKVVIGLEEAGFMVICVVTDNNAINRKAMSLFSNPPKQSIVYLHPQDSLRPLFYLVDTVHLLKCMRNNWLNQKTDGVSMLYPDFEGDSTMINIASFSTLRELHRIEASKLLKYGYRLSVKALWPSNLERQNVKFALQIFSDYTCEALKMLGPSNNLRHYENTSKFITIVYTWWKIVNVKTPRKGRRLNDSMQEPVTDLNDARVCFLKTFLNWLDKWRQMSLPSGTFTKETLEALRHTSYALIEICNYCFTELNMSYVLLGKFQTDSLEERFGMYRQFAGAQYNISLRQVFEVEKKLRLNSKLKEILSCNVEELCSVKVDEMPKLDREIEKFVTLSVDENDFISLKDEMPVIAYLAGYCAFAVAKTLKCSNCTDKLRIEEPLDDDVTGLIKNLSRGSLFYPSDITLRIVTYAYIVVTKLCNEEFEAQFFKSVNQRHLAIKLTELMLETNDELFDLDDGTSCHSFSVILSLVLKASINSLLNNYCKKRNDVKKSDSSKSKNATTRKVQTLKKN